VIATLPPAPSGVTLWTFLLPTVIAHGVVLALFLVQTVALGHLQLVELKLAAALLIVGIGVAALGVRGHGVGVVASAVHAGVATLLSATAYAGLLWGALVAHELLRARRP